MERGLLELYLATDEKQKNARPKKKEAGAENEYNIGLDLLPGRQTKRIGRES